MKQKFLTKIAIAFIALLIICGILELFLGLFKASPLYVIQHESPRPRPDIVNSLRIKDVEHSLKKPDAAYRIAFIGDSYTEAAGVPFKKGYTQVLTQMLNAQRKNQNYEAIICAKWGYNSKDELLIYVNKCEQFNPDLIVVGYVLNDAEGYNAVKRWPFLNSLRIQKAEGIWSWLYQHSHLFRFVYLKAEYLRIRHTWIKGYDAIYHDSATYLESKECLLELKRLALAKHRKLLVALFPYLDYELNDRNPFIKYYMTVSSFLVENKIEVLDLFPYFKGKNNIELQVKPGYDAHPNEKSHYIIAKALFDYLMTHPQYLQRSP